MRAIAVTRRPPVEPWRCGVSIYGDNWGPATAPTREEHDLIVAMRGRPYTAEPMRAAERVDTDSATPSVVDTYTNAAKGST